jgi:hypothetical protein
MSENSLLTKPEDDLLDPPPGDHGAHDAGRGLAERIGHSLGAAARAAMDRLDRLTWVFRPRRGRPRQLPPADRRSRLEPLLRELAELVAALGAAPGALAGDEGFWRLARQIVAIGPPPPEPAPGEAPPAKEAAEGEAEMEAIDPLAGVLDGLEGDEGSEGEEPRLEDKPRAEEKKRKRKKDDESETDEG